jgi:DNA-directed RNA polymerase subunit alpha
MDSLEIEIWTDGRISPRAALEEAARILRDHLQPFLGSQMSEPGTEPLDEEEARLFKLLAHDIETLDLSVRAMNCLSSANIKLIGELCSKTESRLLKCRNFGRKSLDEIKEKIEKLGLQLGMNLSNRLIAALDVESARVRAEAEENK